MNMQLILSDFQDQLVRGLTHRMNNILSVFHGYLGLLMEDRNLDSITRAGLNKIRDGARNATDLIERVNAVSRPAGSVPREIDIATFFRQMAPTFDGLRSPKVRIAIECPDELPRIVVDFSRLKLAITELVRNACEAADSTVRIRVTCGADAEQTELFPAGRTEEPEQWVKIAVTDDGPGIPASAAGRIYEPFFSTKKADGSAGLGLSVALGCAQQFCGNLKHRSGKGGTTFEMVIPSKVPAALSAVA